MGLFKEKQKRKHIKYKTIYIRNIKLKNRNIHSKVISVKLFCREKVLRMYCTFILICRFFANKILWLRPDNFSGMCVFFFIVVSYQLKKVNIERTLYSLFSHTVVLHPHVAHIPVEVQWLESFIDIIMKPAPQTNLDQGGFLKQFDSVYENKHNMSREVASEWNPPPTLTWTLVSVIASFMQTIYRSWPQMRMWPRQVTWWSPLCPGNESHRASVGLQRIHTRHLTASMTTQKKQKKTPVKNTFLQIEGELCVCGAHL